MPKLERIEVRSSSKLDFDTLKTLSRLPRLKSLSCTLKEGTLPKQFSGQLPFASLETLDIGVSVSDADLLSQISQIESLKRLEFKVTANRRSFALTENQTAGFAALRHLEFLEIDGVTDASLVNICKAGNLNHIYLKFGTLTAKSLETLQSHPKLKKVRSTHSGLKHRQLDSIGF